MDKESVSSLWHKKVTRPDRLLINAKQRERYQRNKEAIKARQKKWAHAHKDLYNLYGRRYKEKIHLAVLEMLGGKCNICGIDEGLQIHHINGGGMRELRDVYNNNIVKRYRAYLNNPEESKKSLKLLCKTHHTKTEHKNGALSRRNKRSVRISSIGGIITTI